MNQLPDLPAPKKDLLNRITDQLKRIDGITAVALGGSYAAGTQHADSDFDIGLYYEPEHPFLIHDIRQAAEVLAEGGSVTVTDFYGWGDWVNGGAWIHTPVGKVDFLYRNLLQVRKTIDEAQEGISHHDYDQQPSNGFYSVIYLAETSICIPLYDPAGVIDNLKRQVKHYPPLLKTRIIQDSLWSAEFTLAFARDFSAKGDVYNTAACLSRIAANLTQALFALNETYFIREKQVMQVIDRFPVLPDHYANRLTEILACPGATQESLQRSVQAIQGIWTAVVNCTEGVYQPKFIL
ncbi:MAG: nucleotidyltransferase domain-containing protein [Anaerolineae bacterium]|nr:nucleotidyltransferase domain-containing protein [Anaerolineae bacterium]